MVHDMMNLLIAFYDTPEVLHVSPDVAELAHCGCPAELYAQLPGAAQLAPEQKHKKAGS